MARKKHGYVPLGVTIVECVRLLIVITEMSFIELSLQIFTLVRKSELLPSKEMMMFILFARSVSE
jgi:hypothetical protein